MPKEERIDVQKVAFDQDDRVLILADDASAGSVALRQALQQAEAGHGQVVAAVGETGVRKSRLE